MVTEAPEDQEPAPGPGLDQDPTEDHVDHPLTLRWESPGADLGVAAEPETGPGQELVTPGENPDPETDRDQDPETNPNPARVPKEEVFNDFKRYIIITHKQVKLATNWYNYNMGISNISRESSHN